ncbi:MAG: DNA-binding response regulator [Chloroflexi bacterium]|nr:MAG: DNA-binding response regulator [Chloroflexota bacterium]
MMKILIVDDHILFREGLTTLLDAQPDIQVAGTADSVASCIEVAQSVKPDIILMDFTLPDGTGLEATKALLKELPEIKIVFLTMHEDDERLFDAIRAGAKGYLLKNIPVSKLLSFLRGVEQGEAALSGKMTAKILEQFAQTPPQSSSKSSGVFARLTPRELQVLRELSTGATNQEIARKLVISERTVKNHVSNILAKLNLKNRYEASAFARQHGLKR